MKKTVLLANLLVLTGSLYAQFNQYSEPVRLGGTVNSDAEESMPVFSKDSSFLYFARTYDPSNTGGASDLDIWVSKKNSSGEYIDCERVKDLDNKLNNAVFGISTDENTLYLLDSYEGKKDKIKGCAISNKKGNTWSAPIHLDIPTLDIEGDLYGFHVNKAENVILISHKGPGTIGEEDLYVSVKEGEGWSAPIHLGNVINTVGYEISPFLSEGQDTLYFSSNGHGGIGDADIFYSIRQGESWTEWGTPVNLGDKINSPKFDAYFSRSPKHVFWSSNRDGDKSDIYYANILTPPVLIVGVKGTDVSVCQGSDGKIDMTIEGGVPPFEIIWTNGQETEDIVGLKKGDYAVIISDAVGQSAEINITIGENCPPVPLTPPVEPDIAAASAVIYFDLNSSFLNDQNITSLKDFVQNNAKTNVKIHVSSHCDSRDTDEYNIWLSKRRMERTISYLVRHGISKSRITGDYKGEKDPDIKCTDCTEEQFTKNRRTTITLVQ